MLELWVELPTERTVEGGEGITYLQEGCMTPSLCGAAMERCTSAEGGSCEAVGLDIDHKET